MERKNVLTVSQVNSYIKSLINEVPQIRNLYICGEISNFKHYYKSGHMYFDLKDEKTKLKCVMFSFENAKLKFTTEDGMKVICFGQIDVYERDGVYQLYVRDMHPEGLGDLTAAYEQLKEKLKEEGLFSKSGAREKPPYPRKIGVATSNMGAAVEDIKNVISRRYPLCEIIIAPTVVQGDAAAPDIVKSIELLDSIDGVDIIIVGRGGGSIEDLWAFNTEPVARAVFNCKTYIISAVGHETDFTICDFVADMRAPTPSAAAELAVPDIKNEIQTVMNYSAALETDIVMLLENEEKRIRNIIHSSPLANTNAFFETLVNNISDYEKRILFAFKEVISKKEGDFKSAAGALNALSPLAVLSRGYSITMHSGKPVKSDKDVSAGDEIDIKLHDGNIKAEVK